jgi:bacteriocin-like protein
MKKKTRNLKKVNKKELKKVKGGGLWINPDGTIEEYNPKKHKLS